jgi:hypothetical protein
MRLILIIKLFFFQTYPSPQDEVAVFSLTQKRWYLKRAVPSQGVS